MNLTIGISVGIGSALLVVLGGYLAHKDGFLTVRQMQAKGFPHGLPFLMHGAMWSDLILLSPLFGVITGFHAENWSPSSWLVAVLFGIAVSLLIHYLVFLKGSMPGSHGYNGKLTATGWVHVCYMALALAMLSLFYFATPGVDSGMAFVVSVVLGLHIFVGFGYQALLSLLAPSWFPENPYKSPGLWIALILLWTLIYWCYRVSTA